MPAAALKKVLLASIQMQGKRIDRLVREEREDETYNNRLYREFEALAKLVTLHEGLDGEDAQIADEAPAWVNKLSPEVSKGLIRTIAKHHSQSTTPPKDVKVPDPKPKG